MNSAYFLIAFAGKSDRDSYYAYARPSSASGGSRLHYLYPRAMDTVLMKRKRDAREISALTERAKEALRHIDHTQV